MGPISTSYGVDHADPFFCAIDASGRQDVVCWGNNGTALRAGEIPGMAGINGGGGFMCGILSNTSRAYCWDWDSVSTLGEEFLVPSEFRLNEYSHIAAGLNHVCAIRGLYYSGSDSGYVDCWDIDRGGLYNDDSVVDRLFKRVVSGEGFSCGEASEGGVVCWGPNSTFLKNAKISKNLTNLASGRKTVCGIDEVSREVTCWGNDDDGGFGDPPKGIRFVSLAAGEQHYCGIREDDHGIECWGKFNASAVPKGNGFFAIASTGYVTCGIRDTDLVLDCWFANETDVLSSPDYDPPLELCSPGLCISRKCGIGEFAFNASSLNEPDLSSLCVRKDLSICAPCGFRCSPGFFVSSPCTDGAARVCTPCSLCDNSSCSGVCRLQTLEDDEVEKSRDSGTQKLVFIIGPSVTGFLLILVGWCVFPYLLILKSKGSCVVKPRLGSDPDADKLSIRVVPCPRGAQIFRLSDLKDATNGFKEFNELGRGSYGFVYKAKLLNGQQVAIKRANAATIISTNIREFESELDVLCKLRHPNIVNLLGYCVEMGERILVYEYMPRGTLYDHIHDALSPLDWSLRLKIAMQAAKGLQYLHEEAVPPIIHRNVKTSSIFLDSEWGARVSDFGFPNINESDINEQIKSDVYDFGIVLLEIFCGRKGYDGDCSPPNLVEWAVPLIRKNRAAAIIDSYVALPRNFEPLLRLADVAAITLREDPSERPMMSQVAALLEQIVQEGLI
ncbi:Serine/threonine-protein kinase-like protein [Drosera capensis]